MSTDWIVLKFGGTSVAGRAQWDAIAHLAAERREEGARVLLVCSAVAGVTSALSGLADRPQSEESLAAILERHRELATALDIEAGDIVAEAETRIRQALAHGLAGEHLCARADLQAVGEWLSTRIGARYLQQTLALSWVDVREALLAQPEPELSPVRRWLSADCLPGADPGLRQRWEALEPVVITQGFIARDAEGATVLLGRGGSDTSAALLAGRLDARCVEIWTDVPGLFSADPRREPNARLLTRLGYAEALEMAASGARVIHPRAIRAAQATATPIVIRDTGRPALTGTRIESEAASLPGVKAVTCQAGMIVLLLQNIDARREVGFLARVFDIMRRQGVSVDLVATSETTTTVAINGPANHLDGPALDRLISKLEAECTVERHDDCVCVNLVGSDVRKALARVGGALAYFDDHPLLMLSQSANDLCISLLVESRDHEQLLQRLHANLFPSAPMESHDVLGPRWQALEAG